MSFWAFSFFVVFFMASSAFSAEVEQYVPAEQDVLQRHVSFFDRNHDGIIYPSETVEGMKAIGINPFLAQSSAALIHMAISPVTTEFVNFHWRSNPPILTHVRDQCRRVNYPMLNSRSWLKISRKANMGATPEPMMLKEGLQVSQNGSSCTICLKIKMDCCIKIQ
ncbi:uncharacterized protein LOC123205394 isoform X2 [Mangifera indica]|uniref:uncharacterized protein LOC123205394 isoform X2 n=1 Tax=Mangifera indica TaxID=29780 RepID=UPI001CFA0E14|nr:uncharacterized protein LOC123205394 isoform X2 [Mangifera indica]